MHMLHYCFQVLGPWAWLWGGLTICVYMVETMFTEFKLAEAHTLKQGWMASLWWPVVVILELGKIRQEDCLFKVGLDYTAVRDSLSKNQIKSNQTNHPTKSLSLLV